MKLSLLSLCTLLALLLLPVSCSPAPEQGPESPGVQEMDHATEAHGSPEEGGDGKAVEEDSEDELSSEGMAQLAGNAVALRLLGQEITVKEVLEYFRMSQSSRKHPVVSAQRNGDALSTREQKALQKLLQGAIQRKVLLQEARKAGMVPTAEDRHRLALRWSATNPGQTLDDYLARFPESPENPLQISRKDALLLLKYLEAKLAEVEIPEKLWQDTLQQRRKLQEVFDQEMAKKLEEFKAIAEMDGFHTDEGFCLLARNFSEGTESAQGGVFSTPMTRQEIEDCNWGQPFTLKKGESSALIETPTSYRYIRVLEEYPPQQAGGEETLKVAQILLPKRQLEGIPTEEQLQQRLRKSLQAQWTLAHIAPTLRSQEFDCPLFPLILENWLPTAQ